MITPSRLSRSLRPFMYSSTVYACHFFLISSAPFRSKTSLSFIVPIFAWSIPFILLIFLKRSLVFLILWFPYISLHSSLKKAFFISPCYSLELCIKMCISFLFSFAFGFIQLNNKKTNEPWMHATTWMDLKGILLNDIKANFKTIQPNNTVRMSGE